MALVLADRVQETTATTGTGTITLAGAVAGFQSFAVVGDGNTTYYTITSGTAWEVGIGTYTAAGPTLARTTILSSSAGGAAISLTGTSTVFVTYPAERSVNYNEADNLTVTGRTTLAAPNTSAAAWTTAGINLVQNAATFTDTTSSGTVADIRVNNFAAQTLAASSATTVTNLYGTYFTAPAAGTNVTATERFALGADSVRVSGGLATIGGVGMIVSGGNFAQICTGTTTGQFVLGSSTMTGTMTLGQSTVSQTTNIQAGVTASGSTKTINIGTGGAAGSTTNITIGPTSGTRTTTINGTVVLSSALPVASGGTGTGSTPTNGQLLIGNGSGYTVSTLTAGSGISITNGVGSVTIAAIAPAVTVRGITLTGSAGTFSNAGTPGTYPLLGYTVSGSNFGAGYYRSTSSGNFLTSNVLTSATIVNSAGVTTSYTAGTDFSSSLTFSVMNDAVGFYAWAITNTALQTLFSDTATATTSPSLRPLNAAFASDTTNPVISVSRSPGAPYNNTGFFGSGIYVTKVSTVYTLAFGTNDTLASSGFTVTALSLTINNSLTTYIAGTDFFPSSPQNSSTGMFSMSMTVSNVTLQALLDNSIRA